MADISALHKSLTNQSEQLKSIHTINLGISKGIDKLVDLQIATKKQRYEEARDAIRDKQKQAKLASAKIQKDKSMTGRQGGLINELFGHLGKIFQNLRAFDWGKWLALAGIVTIFQDEIKDGLKASFSALGSSISTWWDETFKPALDKLADAITPQWLKDFIFSEQEYDPFTDTWVTKPSQISKWWNSFSESLERVANWFGSVDRSIGSILGMGKDEEGKQKGPIGEAWRMFSDWMSAIGFGFKEFADDLGISKDGKLTTGGLATIIAGVGTLVALFGVKSVLAAPFMIGRIAFTSIWGVLSFVGGQLGRLSLAIGRTLIGVTVWGAAQGLGLVMTGLFHGITHLEGLTKKGGLLSRGLSRLGLAAGSFASYLGGVNPLSGKSPIEKKNLTGNLARGGKITTVARAGGLAMMAPFLTNPIVLTAAVLAGIGFAGYKAYESYREKKAEIKERQEQIVELLKLTPEEKAKLREEATAAVQPVTAEQKGGGWMGAAGAWIQNRFRTKDPTGGFGSNTAEGFEYWAKENDLFNALQTARAERDPKLRDQMLKDLTDEYIADVIPYEQEIEDKVRELAVADVETLHRHQRSAEMFLPKINQWRQQKEDGFGVKAGHWLGPNRMLALKVRPQNFFTKLNDWLKNDANTIKPLSMAELNKMGLYITDPKAYWSQPTPEAGLYDKSVADKYWGGSQRATGFLAGIGQIQKAYTTRGISGGSMSVNAALSGDPERQARLQQRMAEQNIITNAAIERELARRQGGDVINQDQSTVNNIIGSGDATAPSGGDNISAKDIQMSIKASRDRVNLRQ